MSTGLDDKYKQKLTDAWNKNLYFHKIENFGHTFIRTSESIMVPLENV
jgi:hypothetical protein